MPDDPPRAPARVAPRGASAVDASAPAPRPGDSLAPRDAAVSPRGGRGARAVAELIPAVGDKAFRRFGFVSNAVVARWAEIVGEHYARYSTPEAITFAAGRKAGGTLKVVVTGSFAPMLKHVEPQVVERVNRFFGYAAVARLVLRHGDLPTVQRAARRVEQPLSPETESTLRDIADPDLRATLDSLARALVATRGPPVVR